MARYPRGVTVKLLYPNTSPISLMAESFQANLSMAGFHVDLVPAVWQIFFGNYLENPSSAKHNAWDLALMAWCTGSATTAAALYNRFLRIRSLLARPGGYSSPLTDSLINKALASPSVALAAVHWSQAERQVLADAAAGPLAYENQAVYHSSAVHGCIYWWGDGNCDPTNVWLSR